MTRIKKALTWLGLTIAAWGMEQLLSIIPFENIFVAEKLDWLVVPRFNIINVTLFIISFIILVMLYHFLINKIFNREEKIARELKKRNNMIDRKKGIKVTWDVYMGTLYNNDPFPSNIRIFCTKHDIPQLFVYGSCPCRNCPNSQILLYEHNVKSDIESYLLAERDKLMKK